MERVVSRRHGVPVKAANAATGAKTPPAWENKPLNFPDDPEGSLRTPATRRSCTHGEDRFRRGPRNAGAVAVRPKDGKDVRRVDEDRELFTLATRTTRSGAKFELYGRGLYQDALSMLRGR